ncbi:MAG TPA: hypothetical protein PLC59_10920 [Bacteroidales bacterium]|nr:hypothetical protein [Bacteroidales bacterium]
MKNSNFLTTYDLDVIFDNWPKHTFNVDSKPQKWKQINAGQHEIYLGDNMFIVVRLKTMPDSNEVMLQEKIKTEKTIVKYLQSEGFIGEQYVYVEVFKF